MAQLTAAISANTTAEVTLSTPCRTFLRALTWWRAPLSHVLQELAATILTDPATPSLLDRAREAYRQRCRWLTDALAARGIPVTGDSGFNLWIPVRPKPWSLPGC